MKAAIYARVSTDEQTTTGQMAELRAAAQRRGFVVELEVEETGSGARGDRPGWQRVLTAARKGEVGAVLVAKLDRAGRSVLDLLAQLEHLRAAGCEFHAVDQGLTIRGEGDAMSTLMLHVLAAVAEFERALIRDRTKAGLRRAEREGRKGGRPAAPPVDLRQAFMLRRPWGDDGRAVPWAKVARQMGIPLSRLERAVRARLRELDEPAADLQKGSTGGDAETPGST